MSDRTLSVWVGATIIYLYGTVNGEAATFTLLGDGYWQASVPRTSDDNYVLHLEAYSENGLEGTYDYTLYYGMMPSVIDRAAKDVELQNSKGCYNYEDLNRVGHNVDFLAGVLKTYGYGGTVTPKTDWAIGDIPTYMQMTLYLTDVITLKDAFYGTTALPMTMDNIDEDDANNIEKFLIEIETNISHMIAAFQRSGVAICGTEVIL